MFQAVPLSSTPPRHRALLLYRRFDVGSKRIAVFIAMIPGTTTRYAQTLSGGIASRLHPDMNRPAYRTACALIALGRRGLEHLRIRFDMGH